MPIKKISKKIIILGLTGLFLISITFIIFIYLSLNGNQKNSTKFIPTPIPEDQLKEETLFSSPYATDEAILSLEKDIQNLDQELQNTDLKERQLLPPPLDMEIKFEEK